MNKEMVINLLNDSKNKIEKVLIDSEIKDETNNYTGFGVKKEDKKKTINITMRIVCDE